jgi:hypothetical protein
MVELSITPSIVVRIGRQSRLYYAFITSAPRRLDAPSTMTLYTSTLSDVAVFAADEIAVDGARARTCARLVLIESNEFAWQRARYGKAAHFMMAADDGFVGVNTLQHWLWQRLRRPMIDDVHA